MKKLFPLLLLACACRQVPPDVKIARLESNTRSLLQAISIVDKDVAWISGHDATLTRTLNGGQSWEVFEYPEIDSLQFRDIYARDKNTAVLMSAGPGKLSRIFIFSAADGWKETYVMNHPEGFLNTIEFWDTKVGLAFGDSFNNELFILKTTDGGNSWQRIDPANLPDANSGEGGFAASGTCIATRPDGMAWIGTGAGGASRVLRTTDYGESWESFESPIVKGEAAGITSIRMVTDEVGTMVGGNLMVDNAYTQNVAFTKNSGTDWTLTGFPKTKGAFYGSDIIPVGDVYLWMACGPKGMDFTWDLGKTWVNLDTLNLWAVALHPKGFGYAAGRDGNLVKISLQGD